MALLARHIEGRTQTLKDHVDGVRKRMKGFGFQNLESTVLLLATLHDLGKYASAWQTYLMSQSDKIVPHSLHGAHYISATLSEKFTGSESFFMRDILSYVIQAHHGLFDALSPYGYHGLEHKKENFESTYLPTFLEIEGNFAQHYDKEEINMLLENSYQELKSLLHSLHSHNEVLDGNFSSGVIIRMLLSALIDADWSDAASFHGITEEAVWDEFEEHFAWDTLIHNLESFLQQFDKATDIEKLRQEISDECEESAKLPSGIYRLFVPTGGGKTLTVMRYALRHAKMHGKKRIIYAAPYKSIIEQTATVYRDALFSDETAHVRDLTLLEHHGDVIVDQSDEDVDSNSMYDFLTDRWKSPIILTTLVQLLNTMFSDSKKSIRRLHNLANSVVVIDEFQAVPNRCKTIFNLFINTLALEFGTSFVLCSATQPPFKDFIIDRKSFHKLAPIAYREPMDLVSDYSKKKAFARTTLVDDTRKRPYSIEDLTTLVSTRMNTNSSMLIVLNTRAAVSRLYEHINNEHPDYRVFVLSNNMCSCHIAGRISEIRRLLDEIASNKSEPKKLLVISTSLIEAGVDISFDEVIRSLTGLDTILQAAGRCNRHGLKDVGIVRVINLSTEIENVSRMDDIVQAQEVMFPILNDFKVNPARYDDTLFSNRAIEIYYKNYYREIARKTHYPLRIGDEDTSIFDLLSENQVGCQKYKYRTKKLFPPFIINQAFLTAGKNFEAISEHATRIFVPLGDEGRELLFQLGREYVGGKSRRLLKRVEQYSVALTRYQYEQLKGGNAIFTTFGGGVEVLREEFYSDAQGVILNPENQKTLIL